MTARIVRRIGLVLVAALAAGAALAWPDPAVMEAWLLAFVGLAGLGTGALGLLMIGHLLGGWWLDPVRAPLEAAALTLPLVAVLGIPLVPALPELYPWAAPGFDGAGLPEVRQLWLEPLPFVLRGAICLAIWCGLALFLARPGDHFGWSIAGLVLLTPTTTITAIDWVMSRDPTWWSSLFGFAFSVTQLLPVLAGAILIGALGDRGRPEPHRLRSLEQVLLTLALLTAWIWFVQFLIIWMADLPDETRWYLHRYRSFGGLMIWVAVPAMTLAIVLIALPRAGGPPMVVAATLLLAQHAAHMIWLVRPADGPATLRPMDAIVGGGLLVLWILWATEILRWRPGTVHG